MICLYQILVVLLVRRVGARDDAAWMINVTRYGMDAGVSGFSQFTPDELTELESRAYLFRWFGAPFWKLSPGNQVKLS